MRPHRDLRPRAVMPARETAPARRTCRPCACRGCSTTNDGRGTSRGSTARRSCASTRVLFGEEEFVAATLAVAVRILGGSLAQLEQLPDDLVFARLDDAGRHRVAVGVRVAGEVIEARVAGARARRRLRIDLVQIRDHRLRSTCQGCRDRDRRSRPCASDGRRSTHAASGRTTALRCCATSTTETARNRRAPCWRRRRHSSPRTKRLTRYASGQSASTATAVRP